MIISAIVAASTNDVIGKEGKVPWKLKDDMKSFRKLTMGHHLVFGRKTFESIGKPLPGRNMMILTKNQFLDFPGCEVFLSLEKAIDTASKLDENELFIGGGEEIYKLSLPFLSRVYFTRVHTNIQGDAHWPMRNWNDWGMKSSSHFHANDRNQFHFDIEVWDKIPAD